MARIRLDDADKFSNSKHGFFQLKNDGDMEKVRFMYETIDDIDAYVVHRVKIGNQERYVNCLRESADAPNSDCPLCAAGNYTTVRLFLPLYSVKEGVVKFWERGKTMIKRLQSLCSRYNPLCGTVIEIERIGAAGDNQTTYQCYPCESEGENVTLDDLPEVPKVLGSLVLDKTKEELEDFVKTGEMPGEDNKGKKERNVEEDAGVRRRVAPRSSSRRREGF